MLSVAGRAGTGALQLLTTVALARLLVPEDFGLVAIVFALGSFAPVLIDLGLTDATIQKEHITPSEVSSLFWITLSLSLVVALGFVLLGPLMASVYGQPRLSQIAQTVAVSFLFYGASVQHIALLRRAMRFSDIAVIEIIAYFAGAGVAVVMALLGSGYWALVARSLVTAVCLAGGTWIRCNWRPGLPSFNAEALSMVKFGFHVTGYSLSHFVTRAVDRAGLGLFYSPATVGIYQNALLLYENAIHALMFPLHTVGISALSKLRQDTEALKRAYVRALSNVAFYAMPAFVVLAVAARDLVPLILGDKWIQAGGILSILALRGVVHTIESSQGWLHLALGQPRRWMQWGFLTALVQVIAVGLALPFGAAGVAVAYVLAGAILTLPSVIYAAQPLKMGYRTLLDAVGRQLLGAAVALIAGSCIAFTLAESMPALLRILTSASVCILAYAAIVIGIFQFTDPLRLLFQVGRRAIPMRSYARRTNV